MSYHESHLKMRPVLEAAERFSVAENPEPDALFEAGSGGFQIWCTPEDHPAGWENIPMCAGAFSKPCEYVASILWGWEGDNITHLVLSTDAYALKESDMKNGKHDPYTIYHNRVADVDWAYEKVRWLFKQANVLLPTVCIESEIAVLA